MSIKNMVWQSKVNLDVHINNSCFFLHINHTRINFGLGKISLRLQLRLISVTSHACIMHACIYMPTNRALYGNSFFFRVHCWKLFNDHCTSCRWVCTYLSIYRKVNDIFLLLTNPSWLCVKIDFNPHRSWRYDKNSLIIERLMHDDFI